MTVEDLFAFLKGLFATTHATPAAPDRAARLLEILADGLRPPKPT